MFQECRHIKASGTKGEAPALKGEQFCYFHSRSRANARRHVDYYQAIEIPLIEDRGAIQHALTEVARAIANHNMDTKRAGLLLYSLQIASQNARNQDEIIGGEKQVREVTRTEEGTDLGPETTAPETTADNPETMPYGWLFQAIKEKEEFYAKEATELHENRAAEIQTMLDQQEIKPDATGI
jgi:hypothetical protein